MHRFVLTVKQNLLRTAVLVKVHHLKGVKIPACLRSLLLIQAETLACLSRANAAPSQQVNPYPCARPPCILAVEDTPCPLNPIYGGVTLRHATPTTLVP